MAVSTENAKPEASQTTGEASLWEAMTREAGGFPKLPSDSYSGART